MVAEVGDIAPRVGFGECIVDRLPGSRISRGRFPLPGEGEAFEVDDAPRRLPQRPSSQGVCVSTVAGWFASRTNRSSARGARNPRADRRHAAIVRLMIRDPMGSPARGGTGLPHDAYVPACGRGCLQRLSRWSRRRSGRRPPGWPVGGYWASRRCTEAVRPGPMILRGRANVCCRDSCRRGLQSFSRAPVRAAVAFPWYPVLPIALGVDGSRWASRTSNPLSR